MPDAFIYDHVRTPRGRGKQDGALHEVTALRLAETALRAIRTSVRRGPAIDAAQRRGGWSRRPPAGRSAHG